VIVLFGGNEESKQMIGVESNRSNRGNSELDECILSGHSLSHRTSVEVLVYNYRGYTSEVLWSNEGTSFICWGVYLIPVFLSLKCSTLR